MNDSRCCPACVAFVALSNALRELKGTDWEDQVSDARDDVESALIAVRESEDFIETNIE